MTDRRVTFVNFQNMFAEEREAIHDIVDDVLASGIWVGGDVVDRFENEIAAYCQVKESVAVNSGTDALILGMQALGIGPSDEVITPPNSFIASTSSIVRLGAVPVFVDVREDQNIDPALIESAITPRTKAIMPVHLTGRISDMDSIMEIANRHDLIGVEDSAQSIGSRYNDRPSGSIGHIGCFSAHPLKNLNAMGDAGFITTNDTDVAARIRRTRNIGMADRDTVTDWGTVSRMDPFQAAVLLHRMQSLATVIERKQENVERYRSLLNTDFVFWPPCQEHEFNAFQNFVVQVPNRDGLQSFLAENGIDSGIHYPVPLHLQPVSKKLGYGEGDFPRTEEQARMILSLPTHIYLDEADIVYVAETINKFFEQGSQEKHAS